VSASVLFRVRAPASERDLLLAELHALGTAGLQELEHELLAYFDPDCEADAIRGLADVARGIEVSGPEPVPDRDWEEEWRKGLAPRQVGPLWIRPSWCDSRGVPELLIDPEQAFGSGEHATTRLALELLLETLRPGERVLDVGSGSGILGLGALRCGAAASIGIEIDRQACANALDNAARNALSLPQVCGTLDALRADSGFDIVVANMLWFRIAPWVERIRAHARRVLIVSGYLREENSRVATALAAEGFREDRTTTEAQSGDTWVASRWLRQPSLTRESATTPGGRAT